MESEILNSQYYNEFGTWLKTKFPFKVQKISVNAGFTCPNRDGSKGVGGCTYCNNQSFSPGYGKPSKSVYQQLEDGINFFNHKYPEMKYLAYFQSYTNTYDSTENLISLYEEALSHPNVVGLIIGTRPDCMPNELLDYLEQLSKKTFVMVEYGIESTKDSTLEFINRGHTFQESVSAIGATAAKGIITGTHMILGLPFENREDIRNHALRLNKLPLTTIKLHQLQIIRGTVMSAQYRKNQEWFNIFEVDEYIDCVIDFCEILNPKFIVERFISSSPSELLIAPSWGLKNFEFVDKVRKRFAERKTFQGKYFK